MISYLEYILYGTICFFPFMLFAYYPLRYYKRFSMKVTFLLQTVFAILEIGLFILSMYLFPDFYLVSVALIVIFNVLAYILLYTITIWRILFNLLMIVNIANFTVIFAKFLAILLFSLSADSNFHWINSLCVLITEIVFGLPIFFYVKHYSDSMIRNSEYANKIWRAAWIIPFLLSGLGFTFLYTPSISASSVIDLYGKKAVICAVTLLCLLLTYSYITKLIRTIYDVRALEKDLYQQSIQKMQLRNIETQIQDTRVLRHDLRHHVRLMRSYVDQGEYDKLKDYIHRYSETIYNIQQLHYTDNILINTLLVYYADLCRSGKIEFDTVVSLPDSLHIQDNELTIISSNLLENAYHACSGMDKDLPRFIRVRAAVKSESIFLLNIENSYANDTRQDSCGNFLTTKDDGSGLGLISVKEIVSKYNGYINIEPKGGTFCVSISIPMN